MKLPDSLRDQLKVPLGVLMPDDKVSKENVENLLDDGSYVITVGDRTTERMIEFGLIPSLQIVDGIEKREKRAPPRLEGPVTELHIDNPPAEITSQSIDVIKEIFSMKPPVRLTVTGEEDLLVIPVCIHAPDNAIVLYGQPHEGMVIVKISPEIRNKTQAFLDLME